MYMEKEAIMGHFLLAAAATAAAAWSSIMLKSWGFSERCQRCQIAQNAL
jgi:hypothetical protein